ncbi:Pimeloyl-ACP methyl ester carboxylesterase [Chryseobacterium oleae]|uniref:Pimeloyl-ACP methyl ester carboxylesterase n=1 Tax=Chryseobacterium oleae TaxID=491207 RepID=A0A1I5BHP6_CHROL|nr:alpha/beta hydrolase [Chryseobacterium oleae]SFN74180.1 Pimeloyl-ACP methyl ester carboxylesterase [Chryseobacterium oleae]
MKNYLFHISLFLVFPFFSAQDKDYSEWYLQREDLDIFVKEIGEGKDTVIVVHGGFGANHDYMTDALRGLTNQFHFILYDQRGSLLSSSKKKNLTFQKNVDDLLALTNALKLKKVKLFCHSMGTLIGMEFAKQNPYLVSHLVLAGAIVPKSDSLKSVFSDRQNKQVDFLMNRKEVKALLKPFKEKGINELKSIQDIEKSKLSHKELTTYWRINFAAANIYDIRKHNFVKGGRAYYNQDASIMTESVNWKYDYRNILNTIKTTIINGDYDFLDFHGEILQSQLKEYRKIELKLIPNAGHNSWIDHPNLFRKHLSDALTK